jgi:hypothetical protein
MKSLMHRPLALLISAVTVVALILGVSMVYANVRLAPAPDAADNDNLADADTVLPDDLLFVGDTTGASTETGETADAGARSVWFSWQPATSGTTYLVSSGTKKPQVRVFTGDDYPLTAVTVDTSGGDAAFEAEAGTTYRLQVAAAASEVGAFQFGLFQPVPGGGPDNDDFDNAASLDAQANALGTATGQLLSGTTDGATREDDEPGSGAGTAWYSWTVPNAGAALHVTTSAVTLAAYKLPAATDSPDETPVGLADLVQVSAPTVGDANLSGGAGTMLFLQVTGSGQAFTLTGKVTGLVAPDLTPPVVDCVPPTGWHTSAVVPCTASDAGSGLADTADAAFDLTSTVPEGTATDAAVSETRSVCDKAGNCASAGPFEGLKVDGMAPEVTCDPTFADWTSQPTVSVTCAGLDGDSGLAQAADASFTLTASGVAGTAKEDVAYSTHAPVCDAVGNCTDVTPPAPALIDLAVPVVTCESAPTGWLTQEVSIDCTATDQGSGLADSGDAELELVTVVGDAAASNNAATEAREVCDQAGNCTSVAPVTGLKVDRALPAVTCAQPPDWTRGATLTIHCTATDEGSGLAPADQAFNLTASVDLGTAGLVVTSKRQVCDLAGNCADSPDLGAVGLDDQRPTLSCQETPEEWQTERVAVSCTADDHEGSGLDDADQVFEIAATIPDGTVGAAVALGSRTVCDAADNCSTTPVFATGRIDRVMPQAVCSMPTGPFVVEVTVTCVASDVGSGLADPEHATFTLRTDVGDGTHDAAAYTSTREVCDIAGNCTTAGPVGPFDVDRSGTAPGTGPVLTLPGVVHVLAARAESADLAAGSVPVPFTLPAVVSEIGATVGCTPDENAAFPIGETIVVCSARDGADRTADGAFTVSVVPAPDLAHAAPIWVGGAIRYAGRGFDGVVDVELDGLSVGTATPIAGVVKGGFLIPAGTSLGSHVVVLRGKVADGDPQLVVMPVILSDNAADIVTLVDTPPTPPPGTAGLTLTVTPKRDSKPPFKFVATAKLTGLSSCTGKLVTTVSAKLKAGKHAKWRPLGPAKSTTLRSCTTTYKVKVKAGKLANATKTRKIPVRVTVVYVDASGRTRVTKTVTVKVR